MGQREAGYHRFTARTGTSEKEFTYNSVVLSLHPEGQMTWGSFYDANAGIEQAFRDTLKNETSFDILKDGIGDIGSGVVVNGF